MLGGPPQPPCCLRLLWLRLLWLRLLRLRRRVAALCLRTRLVKAILYMLVSDFFNKK